MTIAIAVVPSPSTRPATLNANVSGLTPGTRYNIRVDGSVIATGRATREGTFAAGVAIGATSKLGGHAADVRDSANKKTLASTTFSLAATAPPPPVEPPPVEPPPVIIPTPDDRPFPPPVIQRTVSVSPEMTSRDALLDLINHTADGTEFRFPNPDAEYVGTQGIILANRHNLIIPIPALRVTGTTGSTNESAFKLDNGNTDLRLSVGRFTGGNPDTGRNLFHSGREQGMGLCVYDGRRIEFSGSYSRLMGDAIFVAGQERAGSQYLPSEDVWCHDVSFDYVGRMGFVPKSVKRFTVERFRLDHVALIAFDLEQDYDQEYGEDIFIRDGVVGSYSESDYQTNWFLAAAFRNAAPNLKAYYRNIRLERISVERGAAVQGGNNPAGKGGLATLVDKTKRTQGLHMADLTTTVAGRGPVINLAHVDGVDVVRIVQPLSSGSLISKLDCTP